VTTGLAESDGSLPPGMTFKVTCGLTACTPGSAPDPTLGNGYGKTYLIAPFNVRCMSVAYKKLRTYGELEIK